MSTVRRTLNQTNLTMTDNNNPSNWTVAELKKKLSDIAINLNIKDLSRQCENGSEPNCRCCSRHSECSRDTSVSSYNRVTSLCKCSSVSEVRKVFVYVNGGTDAA